MGAVIGDTVDEASTDECRELWADVIAGMLSDSTGLLHRPIPWAVEPCLCVENLLVLIAVALGVAEDGHLVAVRILRRTDTLRDLGAAPGAACRRPSRRLRFSCRPRCVQNTLHSDAPN